MRYKNDKGTEYLYSDPKIYKTDTFSPYTLIINIYSLTISPFYNKEGTKHQKELMRFR